MLYYAEQKQITIAMKIIQIIQIYLKLGSGIGRRMFKWTIQSTGLNLI